MTGGKPSCLLLSAIMAVLSPLIDCDAARGAGASSGPEAASPDNGDLHMDIEVIAKRLDIARQEIQPNLGATTYNFSPAALLNIPQGENAPLNQVLLQAPGVAQDSFGQIHVRGDHAGLQYRLDGVQLPEGINIFSQTLEDRAADSISLLTGTLPAQYGFLQAGVVDIKRKSGTSDPGESLEAYGGQRDWYQPSGSWGGRVGLADWFATGDFLHNDIGIENPTDSFNPIHDDTSQYHGLVSGSMLVGEPQRPGESPRLPH